MFARAILLWVAGLITFVPYGVYYLLFEATRDRYALLITSILFWIFGYWAVAGPLLMLTNVRRMFRALESAGTRGQLEEVLKSPDAKDVAIDLIAAENHIPRYLASRVYRLLIGRLARQPN